MTGPGQSLTLQTLASIASGRMVTVRRLTDHEHGVTRLRELGIDEGRKLRVVQLGDPIICQVGECRFGLCRRLARCIYVDECS
ncbi:MAG TPA: FeoA family protein [Phycisphaerae bacterium]|jgi:Fe2+ transport system protein FeoA